MSMKRISSKRKKRIAEQRQQAFMDKVVDRGTDCFLKQFLPTINEVIREERHGARSIPPTGG